MSAFQLFDTSIFIPYFRERAYTRLVEHALESDRLWFSSVVLQELYAGTRMKEDKQDLDIINQSFLAIGRIITPLHEDWITAGKVIARYGRLYGKIEPRDHINDVLILLSAARVRAELLSENETDMKRWAKILKKAGVRITVKGVRR